MEDILSDPSSIPYTTAIHEALQPHIDILRELLDNPTTADIQLVLHCPRARLGQGQLIFADPRASYI